MIKGVTRAHLGPIWYHSEHSDVPYSPKQTVHELFCRFLQQTGSNLAAMATLYIFKRTVQNQFFFPTSDLDAMETVGRDRGA